VALQPFKRRPLGEVLREMRVVDKKPLVRAQRLSHRLNVPLADVLIKEEIITPEVLHVALASQNKLTFIDLNENPPDPHIVKALPSSLCLRYRVLPVAKIGNILLVATARPDKMDELRAAAPKDAPFLMPMMTNQRQIDEALTRHVGPTCIDEAEVIVPDEFACRHIGAHPKRSIILACAIVLGILIGLILTPIGTGAVLAAIAGIMLAVSSVLKFTASARQLWYEIASSIRPKPPERPPSKMPVVSVMVPLLREKEIARVLVRRLTKLTYPKSLLDVVLVLEETDYTTKETLQRTRLPGWMRVVEVPSSVSGLMTKPRALNYAMDCCEGDIIGIWDAEDAPEPDQIDKVVTRFHHAPKDVVCLQGRLDFYNAHDNWMARCFTIEYATWWRLVMPGLARLGFVIPLGGTTVYFRRHALEDVHRWDAHNVTEDADLGVRLARWGYKTEILDTTTYEEANFRVIPWVKQRSRWLKGFAITWLVHIRRPISLYKDLGAYQFAGVQMFFVTALSQFTLAPIYWYYWAILFGAPNPLPHENLAAGMLIFLLVCEMMSLTMHALATRRKEHRHLLPYTPTMILYLLLGCFAMYKALYELVFKPFYWDKTQHGVTSQD
jgi:cellulose synthase/poly-beta-1,6-N-acetylglucosamine synthase-like glycosyltransferase